MANDKRCLGIQDGIVSVEQCNDQAKAPNWEFELYEPTGYRIRWIKLKNKCLSAGHGSDGKRIPKLISCDSNHKELIWKLDPFVLNETFSLPSFSERQKRWLRRRNTKSP
eukprot:Gregarina_sp_Poly_1__8684@NODE_517_length_7789_cov_181_285159_g84_i1_p6_GENE_NODE_517_length_7789_cov_181_285159_g84_i1NODE_517_length_7789_cov_181_285159_g84_i1_p6_ORF_typecomplete_len118_score9_64Ricin_B_lectin/PF00652_22/7_9e08CDtoxinA/PF03498_14/1e05CDtoxinA/PF03498_14/1_4_NODE_517_length_7789_cov_181_285159_g84_i174367765